LLCEAHSGEGYVVAIMAGALMRASGPACAWRRWPRRGVAIDDAASRAGGVLVIALVPCWSRPRGAALP